MNFMLHFMVKNFFCLVKGVVLKCKNNYVHVKHKNI